MNELHNQVARVRRRLVIEQFLARCVWCLFGATAVAATAIAVPRIVRLTHLPPNWDSLWLVASVVAAIVAAMAWTIASRHSALEAAMEIDRRFELRERVASCLSLTEAEQHTEAGRALVNDAVRATNRIDVNDKFRVRLARRAWLPLVPAGIAFALVMFVHPTAATSSLDQNAAAAIAKQINTAAESARKKLAEQHRQAKREGLKSAEGLFQQIEAGIRDLAEKKQLDHTTAAVKLNDLARQLSERRQQLGGEEGLQKQLQNLKQLGDGTVAKIAQAMKQGDFQQAADEANQLARQLRDGKLDDSHKSELAKQLDAMKQEMGKVADAHGNAIDSLQQQLAQQRQSGDLAKAGQTQQKLDELAGQKPQIDALRQLASQLGQSQVGIKKGDTQQSADAMQQAAQQLSAIQQGANEKKILDAAIDQLQAAKEAMLCPNCQGQGCELCNQDGKQSGPTSDVARQSDTPSQGIGTERGRGGTADQPLQAATQKLQVRQTPRRGSAVYAGTVDGPNIKGAVEAAIRNQWTDFKKEASTAPLTSDPLPRNRLEHAEEYFNLLREGK